MELLNTKLMKNYGDHFSYSTKYGSLTLYKTDVPNAFELKKTKDHNLLILRELLTSEVKLNHVIIQSLEDLDEFTHKLKNASDVIICYLELSKDELNRASHEVFDSLQYKLYPLQDDHIYSDQLYYVYVFKALDEINEIDEVFFEESHRDYREIELGFSGCRVGTLEELFPKLDGFDDNTLNDFIEKYFRSKLSFPNMY